MKSEDVIFTLECTMKKRWVSTFLSMMTYMEHLGDIGSSRKVALYSDGDGDFRPKFEITIDPSIDVKKIEPVMDNGGHRLYDAG